MTRIIRALSLACVLAGAAHLAAPPAARATLDPTLVGEPAGDGLRFCCYSADRSRFCCYSTGCYVSSAGCFQLK